MASFKARIGDDVGGYGLTPTYTMGISLYRDALCRSKLYTGWVNEEDEYVQGQGGEGLRLVNLEDEDGNRDNNEGREGKGGTTTTPSTAKNATRKDKKMSSTTTAAYYY